MGALGAVVTAVTRRRPFWSSAARADGFNFNATVLLLPPRTVTALLVNVAPR